MTLELQIQTPDNIGLILSPGDLLLNITNTPYIFVVGPPKPLEEPTDPTKDLDAYNLQQGRIIKTYLDSPQLLKPFLKREYENARKNIVIANDPLVKSIADKYKKRGISLDDLIQEGRLGLLEATKEWDYTKGKLSTWADNFIKKNIRLAFHQLKTKIVYVPRYLYDKREIIRKREREFKEKLGTRPSKQEIANRLHYQSYGKQRQLKPHHIQGVMDLDKEVHALELSSPTQNTPKTYYDPHKELIDKEDKTRLKKILEKGVLGDIELAVISLKFNNKDITNADIGRQLGYSREMIRLIKKEALRKLRFQMQVTE